MDDLLVLLLTVVFIIAGIFGQKNKKKGSPAANVVVERRPKEDLWDFLEDKWEEARPQESEKVVVAEQKPTPKVVDEYRFRPEHEGSRVVQTVFSKSVPVKKEVQPVKRRRFPVKQAVIYSEILQRKYI